MPRSIWLLVLFVFLATAKYTLGPILVRFKSSVAVEPTFDEIPDEHARALFPQNFFALIHEFEGLGFSLVCHLSSSTISGNVHSLISLLVNRSTSTFAAVTFIRSLAANAPAMINYLEFHADFEDGSQLDTGNPAAVGAFYEVPRKTKIRVPHLKDPNALYQVHLYLMKQRKVPAVCLSPERKKSVSSIPSNSLWPTRKDWGCTISMRKTGVTA